MLLEGERKGKYKLSNIKNLDIELKNICYKYEYNSDYVLKNISFQIKYGEFVSIIGKSGSGKTTLAKIILGYQKATSGIISYNNINIEDIEKSDLRNQISMITQDTPILDGSIYYNITLNRDSISSEKLNDVLKKVDLYGDIKKCQWE